MRRLFLLLSLVLLIASRIAAQTVTIDALMAAPFPTELTAAPIGAQFGWVQSVEGVRNVWIAQAPDFKGRKLTNYTVAPSRPCGRCRLPFRAHPGGLDSGTLPRPRGAARASPG